jgi:hypothetical protein
MHWLDKAVLAVIGLAFLAATIGAIYSYVQQ